MRSGQFLRFACVNADDQPTEVIGMFTSLYQVASAPQARPTYWVKLRVMEVVPTAERRQLISRTLDHNLTALNLDLMQVGTTRYFPLVSTGQILLLARCGLYPYPHRANLYIPNRNLELKLTCPVIET